MARLIVTGGSGFLGRRVVPRLVAHHEVLCLTRSADAAAVVRNLGAEPLPGDLDDAASLDAALVTAGADALVNLASLGFGHAPAIVAAAEAAGINRSVFVSTTAIFTSVPAVTKKVRLAAEEEVRRSSLAWTILRPTMIYGGSDDRNVSRLLYLLRRTPVVPVPGGGNRLQQPVHVEDLAAAIVVALGREEAIGREYDLGGPEAIPFRRLIEEAAVAVGRRPRLIPVPLAPVSVAVSLYERLARRPRLRAEQLQRLAEDKVFDIRPAQRDLDYDPRPFSLGVAELARSLA